jgi:hypothetical protein
MCGLNVEQLRAIKKGIISCVTIVRVFFETKLFCNQNFGLHFEFAQILENQSYAKINITIHFHVKTKKAASRSAATLCIE